MRWLVILAVLVLAQLAHSPASAASCTREDFALAVDRAGAAAAQAQRRQPAAAARQDARAQGGARLAGRGLRGEGLRGPAGRAHGRARCAGQRPAGQARCAGHGRCPSSEPDCAKLQELTATSLELQATVKAKAAYTLAKLDQMLAAPPAAAAAEPKSQAPPRAPARPPPPAGTAAFAQDARASRRKSRAGRRRPRASPRREVAIAAAAAPRRTASPPPGRRVAGPEEEGYTIDEIMAASAGFFGKVSANLGAVIEYLFKSSGRPTGYILGTEGGGAFLAGVRYGSGTLYMRAAGTQHADASIGTGPRSAPTFGAAGSKTLFLIYRLKSPDEIYTGFTRHRRVGLLRGRRRRHARHQRQRHPGADPLGRRPAARRQHRLHPLHAEGDVESILTAGGPQPPSLASRIGRERGRSEAPASAVFACAGSAAPALMIAHKKNGRAAATPLRAGSERGGAGVAADARHPTQRRGRTGRGRPGHGVRRVAGRGAGRHADRRRRACLAPREEHALARRSCRPRRGAGAGHHAKTRAGGDVFREEAVRSDGNAILGHILGSKDRSRRRWRPEPRARPGSTRRW